MSHDVFDSYAKIMQESGALDKPLEKTAEEKPLRHDSLDISDFQMLYGVKPNGEDEKSIIDQAHPNPIYIAPAYDKMNGLVENLWERHTIMTDIARKPNDGKLTQERYIKANAELINELTRMAFLLDKNGETELMKIADECTEVLIKKSGVGLAVGIISAIGGAATLWNTFGRDASPSLGVSQDAERFLVEIQDVVGKYSEEHPEVSQQLAPIISEVVMIKEFADRAARIQTMSSQMSDDKDKMVLVTDRILSSDGRDKIVNFFTRYKIAAARVSASIPDYISTLKGEEQDYTEKWWDVAEYALKVYRFFVPSEVEDAIQQLTALKESLSKVPEYVDSKLAIMDKMSEHKDNLSQIKELLSNENMTVEQLEQMAKEQGMKSAPEAKPAPEAQEGVPELPLLV